MQDDRNTVDLAREKYLSLEHPLSGDEQAIIDRDLNSPEFKVFCDKTATHRILPDAYSANATFAVIEKCIQKEASPAKIGFIWKYRAIAASIALLLGLGIYYYFNNGQKQTYKQLTVSTLHGETRKIILPDSSVVVLNSLSTLSYPEKFEKKERNIILCGEGYFKVSKNPEKSFKIQTGDILVEVLGTTFNIQSYPNENTIKTALLEGSVAIRYGNQKRFILRPGEIASYNKSNRILGVETADLSSAIQWKQGLLVFDDCPLEEISRILERQDDVKIEIRDPALKQLKITARFIHNESVGEILEILSRSTGFKYEKDRNKFNIF